ncbi:hypothetical protein L2E82_12980 [Cichorium intybus]|uniref:Uncharacterized protein n=1 Tax=Cichorium intybus TaxID=13427 RepID=A0ACB9GIU4_CICIN|nr:hypothetical protein L2E82_12980 [Cichorium intybus]
MIYHQKLRNHLKDNTQILLVGADNLQANQIQIIRQGLRSDASIAFQLLDSKDGEKERQGKSWRKWEPTIDGYLKFLVDSNTYFRTH